MKLWQQSIGRFSLLKILDFFSKGVRGDILQFDWYNNMCTYIISFQVYMTSTGPRRTDFRVGKQPRAES